MGDSFKAQIKTSLRTIMPATPRMRKAVEKNSKNITKRGNVSKSSKKEDQYPVSPELLAFHLCCGRICSLPNCSVHLDVRTMKIIQLLGEMPHEKEELQLHFYSKFLLLRSL